MQLSKLGTTIAAFLLMMSLQAQEELGNLWNRSSTLIHQTNGEQKQLRSSRDNHEVDITYLYNISNLPFIDDFTTYRIKNFVTDTADPSIFDSLSYDFVVNGLPLDSLQYLNDTVYNYIYNPQTKKLDSTMAALLRVDFYSDSANPFVITSTEFYFPSFSTYTQSGNTRFIRYTPDSTIYNKEEVHYYALDDSRSRWISNGGFWNKTMAINPPTVGLITFDGLDEDGVPYDNSDQFAFGLADEFSSKPINLYRDPQTLQRYTSSDNIYFSFFFQPKGNGDEPEPGDSLMLDFYSPTDARWYRVWSQAGLPQQEFEQVFIHVADTKYLQLGFQFRFRNYAKLSGNFDHWHIDYVRMDKDRGVNDTISDFAFINPIRTLLNKYTSMPWEHYKTAPWNFVTPESIWNIKNLGPNPDKNDSDYKMYLNGQKNPFYKSNTILTPTVPANDVKELTHTINSAPNNFTFPVDTNERQLFEMRARSTSTQDVYRENDTLIHYQLFDRFYAYDDGSAEKTYNLNLVGTSVVVEFKSEVPDTLRGILVNFVETFETPSIQQINLVVYKDLESDPVYQSGPIDVLYKPAGKFQRYDIDPIVMDGKFFIGFQQLSSSKTFIGYDVNHNNKGRTYIKEIGGNWNNTIFNGTIMARADFGDGNDLPLSDEAVKTEALENTIYPNPSTGIVHFKTAVNGPVELYSLSGVLVHAEDLTQGNQLDLSHLPRGFYLLSINGIQTHKLILTDH